MSDIKDENNINDAGGVNNVSGANDVFEEPKQQRGIDYMDPTIKKQLIRQFIPRMIIAVILLGIAIFCLIKFQFS